jgi:hypothetical protein
VMYEDIGAVFPGDKAIALGVIEPLNLACFLHEPSDPPTMLQHFPLLIIRQGKQSGEKPLKKARSLSLPPVRRLTGQLFYLIC